MNWKDLASYCVSLSERAGDLILECAAQKLDVKLKAEDESPVTQADVASEKLILQGLRDLAAFNHDYPCLAEESKQFFTYKEGRFWCVDPLDGTRDFIQGTGDYTVNIALFQDDAPILGVVHVPHLATTYFSYPEGGAFKKHQGEIVPIKVRTPAPDHLRVLISRFHNDPALKKALDAMTGLELVARGSAMKLCMIAEGAADCYPRLTPSCNWDIAAGHAILAEAGGAILSASGCGLMYPMSPPWKLPSFIAVNTVNYSWDPFLAHL